MNPVWKDVILDPAVLELFFTLYWKVRTNPQLAHHARNCLVQLGSLNGGVVLSVEVKLQYLTAYMQSFLKLLSNIEIIDQEALGIASIMRKIITFFKATLTSLPENLLRSFMEQMTRLTCLFAEGAAQEESVSLKLIIKDIYVINIILILWKISFNFYLQMCADDCLYMEAFERMLDTWGSILAEVYLFPSEFCTQSSVQILNTYLQCHLSPPDGKRGAGGKEVNSEEIDACEEDDRTKFKEQLQTIGNFGRQVPGHALPLLARLLEDRTSKLRAQLNSIVSQPETLKISGSMSLESLYEDLHWIILLAGHVLCMESVGEVALIPSEIVRYSMEQVNRFRIRTA